MVNRVMYNLDDIKMRMDAKVAANVEFAFKASEAHKYVLTS